MADPTQTTGIAALPYTVVRIRAGDPVSQNKVHFGTGFFYNFEVGTGNVPLIVSNKHVLCGKTWIDFDLAVSDDQGNRTFGPAHPVRIETGKLPIFEHPDPRVDLAAVPFVPIVEAVRNSGTKIFNLLLNQKNFPPEPVQAILHAATSVVMVGFPNGIMDDANNLPVVRRGILATRYASDYRGGPNFVVDIAAFGGSSGSPVFALFETVLPDGNGNFSMLAEPQFFFLGVLHSGPMMTAEGKIVPAPVPTSSEIARTDVTIHLGYCVKASKVEELVASIRAQIGQASFGAA